MIVDDADELLEHDAVRALAETLTEPWPSRFLERALRWWAIEEQPERPPEPEVEPVSDGRPFPST